MGECSITDLNVNKLLRELGPSWGNETAFLLPWAVCHTMMAVFIVCAVCQVPYLNVKTTCKVDIVITVILQRRALRRREVMYVSSQWQSGDSNPDLGLQNLDFTPSTVRFLGCHLTSSWSRSGAGGPASATGRRCELSESYAPPGLAHFSPSLDTNVSSYSRKP